MTTASALSAETSPVAQPRFAVGGVNLSCIDRPTAVDLLRPGIRARRRLRDDHRCPQHRRRANRSAIAHHHQRRTPGLARRHAGRVGRQVERLPRQPRRRRKFLKDVFADPQARTLRHVFYGGQPETAEHIVARVKQQLGPDAIVGWHAPPFRAVGELEEEAVIAKIASTKPDVIWVGLGAPKQEYWMANHAHHFPGTVLVGVGAALDFYAGLRNRARGGCSRPPRMAFPHRK